MNMPILLPALFVLLRVAAAAAIPAAPTFANEHFQINNFFVTLHNDISYLALPHADTSLPFVADHRIAGFIMSILFRDDDLASSSAIQFAHFAHVCHFLRSRPKHIAFVLNEIEDFSSQEIHRLSRILAAKYVSAIRFLRQEEAAGQQSQLHQRKMHNEKPEVMWLSCVRLLRHVESQKQRKSIVNALSAGMVPGLQSAVDVSQGIAENIIQIFFIWQQFNDPMDSQQSLLDFALLDSLDERNHDQARVLLQDMGASPAAAFEFAIANDDFAMLQSLVRLVADVNVQNGYPLVVAASLGNREAIRILLGAGADINKAIPNPLAKILLLRNDCVGDEIEALRQVCATSHEEKQLTELMDLVEHIPFQKCICTSIGLTSEFEGFCLAGTRALCLYFAHEQDNVKVSQHLMSKINFSDATRSFFASFIVKLTAVIPERTLRLPEGMQEFLVSDLYLQFPRLSIRLGSDSSSPQMPLPHPLHQQPMESHNAIELDVLHSQPEENEDMNVDRLKHVDLDKIKDAIKQTYGIDFVRMLGDGAYGFVFHGTNCEGLDRAVKVCSLDNIDSEYDDEALHGEEQFHNEVAVMEKMKSIPLSTQLLSYCRFGIRDDKGSTMESGCWREPHGLGMIEMELVNGGSMERLLGLLHRQGKLTSQMVLWLFYRMTWAVQKMHDMGVYHNDVATRNMLLKVQQDAEGKPIQVDQVVAADFGLSTFNNESELRRKKNYHDLMDFCVSVLDFCDEYPGKYIEPLFEFCESLDGHGEDYEDNFDQVQGFIEILAEVYNIDLHKPLSLQLGSPLS